MTSSEARKASGKRPLQLLVERVEQQRADDDERALREIDRPRDAIDQREAESDECERASLKTVRR